MKTLKIRKSPRLLELAKRFFGDLVVEAYIGNSDGDVGSNTNAELEDMESLVCLNDPTMIIAYSDDYILEFSNKKRIRISARDMTFISDESNKELEFI